MSYGTFTGLNTALRGLMAQQSALEVTAHNVSNLNTAGYSRQTADLATTTPLTLPAFNATSPSQLGTGVQVTGYSRARDQYLDGSIRKQLSVQAGIDGQTASLQQVQQAYGEPGDSGLQSYVTAFFKAMDDVGTNPDSTSARQAFVSAAQAMSNQFNTVSGNIADVGAQADARLNQTVTDINSLTSGIASLNAQIHRSIASGQNPNDLLDRRDQMLDQLAGKANVTYTTSSPYQDVTVTFAASPTPINIVDPTATGGTNPLTRADLDSAYTAGPPATLTGGTAFADEVTWKTTVPAAIKQLDDLVNSVVTGLNAQNAAGFDLTGTAGGDLFLATGLTAATMAVDPAVVANPKLVAAASTWAAGGEPGNGTNINAMEALRGTVQGAPLGATWESFYQSTVAGIGTLVANNGKTSATQGAIVDSLTGRREEVSGVSLDEEMSNMLRYQHAYNASARALTAFDSMLDTLINRTGKVGM